QAVASKRVETFATTQIEDPPRRVNEQGIARRRYLSQSKIEFGRVTRARDRPVSQTSRCRSLSRTRPAASGPGPQVPRLPSRSRLEHPRTARSAGPAFPCSRPEPESSSEQSKRSADRCYLSTTRRYSHRSHASRGAR